MHACVHTCMHTHTHTHINNLRIFVVHPSHVTEAFMASNIPVGKESSVTKKQMERTGTRKISNGKKMHAICKVQ